MWGKRDAGAIAAKKMRDKEQQKYVGSYQQTKECLTDYTKDQVNHLVLWLHLQRRIKKRKEGSEEGRFNYDDTRQRGRT